MKDVLDCHVIAVDDSSTILKLIELALKKEVRRLDTYIDPAQALEAILRDVPDIIILDIMMPGLSGTEICRRIKEDPRFMDCPVMYLTAVPISQAIEQGILQTGADYFMPKPFLPSQLVEKVKELAEVVDIKKKAKTCNLQDLLKS